MNTNQYLQKRYLKSGLDSFDEIEKLEFLLSLKIDDRNNYNLAKELTTRYTSLNRVVDESVFELKKIPGFKDNHILGLKLPYHFSNIYLNEKSKENPVTKSPEAVHNYLIHSMSGNRNEQFNALFLNTRNEVLENEVLFKGTLNQVAVYPREIIKSAIKYDAAGLILAHNHPSGNLTPSSEDIKITRQLKDITEHLDIRLLDHIIIAGNKYLSFFEQGYLKT